MLRDFRWIDEKEAPMQLRMGTGPLRVVRLVLQGSRKTWAICDSRSFQGWIFAVVDYETVDEMPQHLKDALIEMTLIKCGVAAE